MSTPAPAAEGSGTAAAPAAAAAGNNSDAGSAFELTENIQFMKLVHELKAAFPAVPDELVKSCVLQVLHQKQTTFAANKLPSTRTLFFFSTARTAPAAWPFWRRSLLVRPRAGRASTGGSRCRAYSYKVGIGAIATGAGETRSVTPSR